MTYSYSLALDDIIAFNIFHYLHSPSIARNRIFLKWFIPVWVLLLFFLFNHDHLNLKALFYNIPLFLIGVLWLLLIDRFSLARVKRNVRKMLGEGSNNGMTGPQKIHLEEGLLIVENGVGITKYNLTAVKRMAKDAAYLYLYITSVSAVIVPRSVFKSEAEQNEFIRRLSVQVSVTS